MNRGQVPGYKSGAKNNFYMDCPVYISNIEITKTIARADDKFMSRDTHFVGMKGWQEIAEIFSMKSCSCH